MTDASKFFSNMSPKQPAAAPQFTDSVLQTQAERLYGAVMGKPAPAVGQGLYPTMPDPEEVEPIDVEVSTTPAAEKLFGNSAPGEYVWTVPEDLAHLGLVPDEKAASQFTILAKSMNLSQSKATELLHLHLRSVHGGGK